MVVVYLVFSISSFYYRLVWISLMSSANSWPDLTCFATNCLNCFNFSCLLSTKGGTFCGTHVDQAILRDDEFLVPPLLICEDFPLELILVSRLEITFELSLVSRLENRLSVSTKLAAFALMSGFVIKFLRLNSP